MYDQDIHLEIAQLAGNETFKKTLGHVFERIVLKRRTDGLYDAARGVKRSSTASKAIASDGAAQRSEAVKIVRAHIRKGKENVLVRFEAKTGDSRDYARPQR